MPSTGASLIELRIVVRSTNDDYWDDNDKVDAASEAIDIDYNSILSDKLKDAGLEHFEIDVCEF
jgi:hypothetical protein